MFISRLNNPQQINQDFHNIESYLKVLNEKSNQDNFEVIKKITEIFKDDKNSVKIFTIVEEINKINLSNSTNTLKIFLQNVLKYNEVFKLYLEETNKINRRYKFVIPFSLVIFSLLGLLYLKQQIKFKPTKIAEKIVNNYFDNLKHHFKLNIKFPIFNDHRNLTNLIFFNESNSENILCILGPSGIGKTESIKNYCFRETQNGKFIIYIDFKKWDNQSISEIISSILLSSVKPKTWLSYMLKNIVDESTGVWGKEKLATEILNSLADKDVTLIFDHYSDEKNNKIVFDNINLFKSLNFNVLIMASNNEILPSAIRGKHYLY